MIKDRPKLNNLRSQIVVISLLLVIITAFAVGIPAYWIYQNQINRQLSLQIEQGLKASQAIYQAEHKKVADMANLTSQRPTLHDLLITEKNNILEIYIKDLQLGSGFDFVAVCDDTKNVVARSPKSLEKDICQGEIDSLQILIDGAQTIWMLGWQPIYDQNKEIGSVTIANQLDDSYLIGLRAQTGLEHTIFLNDRALATSIQAGNQGLLEREHLSLSEKAQDGQQLSYKYGDHYYYALRFSMYEQDLTFEVAQDIGEIRLSQKKFIGFLFGSITLVVLFASALGIFIAGRISKPLEKLSGSATRLTINHLNEPLKIKTQIAEVSSLANALENARINLNDALLSLQNEKEWSEQLLESIVEGIVTLDDENKIKYFSSGAERITGWEREFVENKQVDEVFKPIEGNLSFQSLLPPTGENRTIPIFLAKNRRAMLAVTHAKQISSDLNTEKSVIVFRDVSEETALNRLVGHFMGNITHEFRTPLSALAASIELLVHDYETLNKNEVLELLYSLHLGTLNLETLIDNLLEGASIEAGRFRVVLRSSNLNEIIEESIQIMAPLLRKYDQKLLVDVPEVLAPVFVDSRRINQVLVNLISNASRYGPRNAEISLTATINPDTILVAVADRGPGIPKHYQEDMFSGVISSNIESGLMKKGTGLGLSVVKAIINAHNGQVGISDNPDGGSIFWFTLPIVSEK